MDVYHICSLYIMNHWNRVTMRGWVRRRSIYHGTEVHLGSGIHSSTFVSAISSCPSDSILVTLLSDETW